MLLDEDRMQGRVKVVTVADARGFNRGEGVEHRARSKRYAGFAQGASEVNDVLREQASALRLGFGKRGGQAVPAGFTPGLPLIFARAK